jgi:hypothetical protein
MEGLSQNQTGDSEKQEPPLKAIGTDPFHPSGNPHSRKQRDSEEHTESNPSWNADDSENPEAVGKPEIQTFERVTPWP